MSQVDNRLRSLAAFIPSFAAQTLDDLREITKRAYERACDSTATDHIAGRIAAKPNEREYTLKYPVVGDRSWLEFGHLSANSHQLSMHCLVQISFKFAGDDLDEVSLKLFLPNAQFIVSDSGFSPAIIGSNHHYQVQGAAALVGLRPVLTKTASGQTDDASLFAELSTNFPVNLMPATTAGWKNLSAGWFRSRIDLVTSWKRKGGVFVADQYGAVAKISAAVTGGARTSLVFWAPGVAASFAGVLHESGRFGLCLTDPGGYANFACIVLGEHATVGNASELKAAKRDFALNEDFRGVVFGAIGAHWLDDGMMGADISSSQARGAVSFRESTSGPSQPRFYASVSAKIDPTNRGSYLSILQAGANLKLSVAGANVRHCSLAATFKVIEGKENPFAWLSARKAMIELKSVSVQNPSSAQVEYKLDVTLDETNKGRLATVTAESLNIGQKEFNYLASVLTLAPVLKLAGGQVEGGSNSKDQRVQFVEIGAGELGSALFAASALGDSWFFREALTATEFRVTGVRILSQPAVSGRETALLFDVETEFSVAMIDPELRSTKALAVRVENTGLLQKGGSVRWVQVLQGAFELKTLDGSAWDFGGLGGLLNLKKVGFQLADKPLLSLTVGLSLNLGMVKADDFKITIDLKSGLKNVTFYPTALEINVPKVLEGKGTIDLGAPGHALDDVAGSIDVSMYSGLRMAGAIQIRKYQDTEPNFTALAVGALIEWPTAIPFGASGLAIKGIQAVYTTHMKRIEKDGANGIPTALQWLKDANGDVAIGAIADKSLWTTEYDRWSFGAGALFVISGAERLLSLNTMLLVELPGPRIVGFIKVSPFEEPESNSDKKDELTAGILGLLEIDFVENRIRAGALINLELADFATLQGSADMQWAMGSLSAWHYFIGHFRRHNQINLKLGDMFTAGASGYFMAAGDRIEGVPSGSGGTRDLAGLALALGARAYTKLGQGSLYLSMEMQAFLNVSLGKNIYASGQLELSGELYIFIGGIGASGRLSFEYYKDDHGTDLLIHGELCGRIRIGFLKVKGCVRARIGKDPPKTISIARLIGAVRIVDGTNVALRGQGALTKIDAVIATLAQGAAPDAAPRIPIDAVIAISLAAAPAKQGQKGFLKQLQDSSDVTEFNYGARRGGYNLSDVSLVKIADDLSTKDVNYGKAEAVWWRSGQRSGDGHAIPLDLALLTRRPFAASNAVPSSETIHRWIDALKEGTGICATLPPQISINLAPTRSVAGEDRGKELSWPLAGRWRDLKDEWSVNSPALRTLRVSIAQRENYGDPDDRASGQPHYLGQVVVEQTSEFSAPIGFLEVRNLPPRMDMPPTKFNLSSAGFVPTYGKSVIAELLIAASDPGAMTYEARCYDAADNEIAVAVPDPDLIADDGQLVHGGAERWKPPVADFAKLTSVPGYGTMKFARLVIELKDPAAWKADEPPTKIVISCHAKDHRDTLARVYVGAIKYLAIEEYRRFQVQNKFNKGVIKELEDYLASRSPPLLDPDSAYRLRLTSTSKGSGITADLVTEEYSFKTDANPPRMLAPYLLGTYPAPDERFHPASHPAGFSLSSGDILKILTRFPDARLRIRIKEDGNVPVTGQAGSDAIDWTTGQIYDPIDLLDLIKEPVGLSRRTFLGLPSALLRAIKEAIAAGKLDCLSKSIELDKGMWFGLIADLEPLHGYTVILDVFDAAKGSPWQYEAGPDGHARPFFEWHFRTGLHRDTAVHAEAFAHHVKRNRQLVGATLDSKTLADALVQRSKTVAVSNEYRDSDLSGKSAPQIPDTLAVIEDQHLENLLAMALGVRPALEAETETLLIWERGSAAEKLSVAAIILRSREPICRKTQSVRVTNVGSDDAPIDVVQLEDMFIRYPASDILGVQQIFVSASGETIVVIPDHAALGAKGRLRLSVKEAVPYYLPFADADTRIDLIDIAAAELSR